MAIGAALDSDRATRKFPAQVVRQLSPPCLPHTEVRVEDPPCPLTLPINLGLFFWPPHFHSGGHCHLHCGSLFLVTACTAVTYYR